jgi:hypothetical protein
VQEGYRGGDREAICSGVWYLKKRWVYSPCKGVSDDDLVQGAVSSARKRSCVGLDREHRVYPAVRWFGEGGAVCQ